MEMKPFHTYKSGEITVHSLEDRVWCSLSAVLISLFNKFPSIHHLESFFSLPHTTSTSTTYTLFTISSSSTILVDFRYPLRNFRHYFHSNNEYIPFRTQSWTLIDFKMQFRAVSLLGAVSCLASMTSGYTLVHNYDHTNWFSSFIYENVSITQEHLLLERETNTYLASRSHPRKRQLCLSRRGAKPRFNQNHRQSSIHGCRQHHRYFWYR